MKQSEKRRIISQLKTYGLGGTDAELYLASLELGSATVQELARKTGQNRVTTHSAVERLKEKSILTETRKGKRRLIVASDPKILRQLLEQKYLEVERMRSGIDSIVGTLQEFQTKGRYFPSVRFYEGVQGFVQMTEESLESKTDLLLFNYIPTFQKYLGPDKLNDYLVRKGERGIWSKVLFPPGETTDLFYKNMNLYLTHIRIVPEEYVWNSSVFLWDDKAALASYKEGHFTTTIIENKDIAQMLRLMHSLIWESMKTYEEYHDI